MTSRLSENILLTMGPSGVVLASSSASSTFTPAAYEFDVAEILAGIDGAPQGIPSLAIRVETVESGHGRVIWYRLPRPAANVVDVTGAGDAVVAGTACAFMSGWPLEDAVIV